MGEVASTVEFLKRLRAEFPNTRLFVSAGTITGKATAEEKLSDLVDGVFYAPVDFVFAVRRVLRTLRPSVVVIAETEIWPNLYRETKRVGAGLIVVNGRISDRAFVRYQRLRALFQAVLAQVDLVLAQSDEIADRFVALGAPKDRVQSGGNFKYDFNAAGAGMAAPVRAFLDRVRPGEGMDRGKYHAPAERGDPDEDDVAIGAFQELAARYRNLLLILVPRKPALFEAAAEKLAQAGVAFVRRTQLNGDPPLTLPGVLLLDTIGELGAIFAAGDVVFMGGTLANRGGHNILEPASHAKPVVVGPHMENFRAIAEDFRRANGFVEIADAAELGPAIAELLADPERARALGQRGELRARTSAGASARAAAEVRGMHTASLPWRRPAQPWYPVAWALSRLWALGGAIDMRKRRARQQRLAAPVVSIGNITVGGTGKTPCVLQVAEFLKKDGYAPGILTRGYGRVSPESTLALGPGEVIGTQLCGDEAQILVRSGVAPVGISASRKSAAELLRKKFHVGSFVLDDGFQHVQVARDVDVVLIDALNPFGGGNLFPLGRLREPMEALERADVVLITRTNFADTAPAIEQRLRRWNQKAPVFHARVEPMAWIEPRTGAGHAPETRHFERAAAFCGLGNPLSFRRSLAWLGIDPAEWIEFNDHHRYTPAELRRMAYQFAHCGVEAVLTTEKDAVNLCEGAAALFDPLPLYYLKVQLVVEREAEFAEAILSRLPARKSG